MSFDSNKTKALEAMYQDEDLERMRVVLLSLIDSTFWLHHRFDFPKETDSVTGRLKLFQEGSADYLLNLYQSKEVILSEVQELGNELFSLNDESKIFGEMIDILVVTLRLGYLYGGSNFIDAVVKTVQKNDAKTLESHVLVNGKIQRKVKARTPEQIEDVRKVNTDA